MYEFDKNVVHVNIGAARSMLMQGLEQIAGAFQP